MNDEVRTPRPDRATAGSRPSAVKTTMGPVELSRPKLRDTDEKFCSQLFGLGVDADQRPRGPRHLGLGAGTVGPRRRGRASRGARRRGGALPVDRLEDLPADKGRVRRLRRDGPLQGCASTTCSWTARTSASTSTRRPSRCCVPGASTPTASRISSASPRPALSRQTPGSTSSKALSPGTSPHLYSSSPTAHRGSSPPSSRSFPARFAKDASSIDFATQSPRSPRPTRTPSRPTGGRSSTRSRNHPVSKQSARPAGASTPSGPSGSSAYPGAVACLVEDFESLSVHLRFPKEHWKRCRHTNLIERTFGETRRRTKVIGRLPGERTCVALVFAVLDRQSRGWRGVTVTPRALRRLQDLRRELLGEQQDPDSEQTVTAAA